MNVLSRFLCTVLCLMSVITQAEVVNVTADKSSKLEIRRQQNQQLIDAVKASDFEAVKSLLAQGASINARDNNRRTLIMHAIIAGHEVKEKMVQEGLGARLVITGLPAPEVKDNQRKIIALLIEKGVDIEAVDHQGKSPLLFAVERNYADLAEMLLEAGADPDLLTSSQMPLLCIVANRGYVESTEVLIQAGANIDARGAREKHAIHYAAEENHGAVVKLLLDKGVDINVVNVSDWTALHTATLGNHPDVVKLLLRRGADASLKTARGWTVDYIANARKFDEILSLLSQELKTEGSNS